MQIDIWSDIACPWCAVGKARFEAALADFEHRDAVSVRWRSFELNPRAPRRVEGDYVALLAAKYRRSHAGAQAMIDQMTETAAEAGLDFHFERIQPGNTFDAHRLLHLAGERGLQDALKARLFAGYLGEGAAIGDPTTLRGLAIEVGLDAAEVDELLGGERYGAEVRADEQQAAAYGISGVPFFVLGGRYAISGAQPSEVMLSALRRGWERREVEASAGATCDEEGCAV